MVMALVKFEAESERTRKVGFYQVASITIRIDLINLDLICICFASTHFLIIIQLQHSPDLETTLGVGICGP